MTQRQLHYAGSNEDDEAHLRLLLRSTRKQTQDEWTWGEEEAADLAIVDAPVLSGDASPARAHACIVDAETPEPVGLFLRRPLHGAALAALLDAVSAGLANAPAPLQGQAAAAVTIETHADPDPVAAATIAPAGQEDVTRPLVYYLPKRVLGVPARILLEGAPALCVDPGARSFWADGPLTALEPYFRQPLRFGDWHALDEAALDAVRAALPARSCLYLTWMDVYLHGNGTLSRRFDPAGSFRLTRKLELANDYPRAYLIGAQMNTPRRLDAIARASGADLAEVHNVIDAFDAIGYLDWTKPGAPARRA